MFRVQDESRESNFTSLRMLKLAAVIKRAALLTEIQLASISSRVKSRRERVLSYHAAVNFIRKFATVSKFKIQTIQHYFVRFFRYEIEIES
jgi:hypothetical protein